MYYSESYEIKNRMMKISVFSSSVARPGSVRQTTSGVSGVEGEDGRRAREREEGDLCQAGC